MRKLTQRTLVTCLSSMTNKWQSQSANKTLPNSETHDAPHRFPVKGQKKHRDSRRDEWDTQKTSFLYHKLYLCQGCYKR